MDSLRKLFEDIIEDVGPILVGLICLALVFGGFKVLELLS